MNVKCYRGKSNKAYTKAAVIGNRICTGKNCNKIGTNELRILYINKNAWFCDNCKKDLEKLELVLEIKNEEDKEKNSYA
jgi:hypothetical protein